MTARALLREILPPLIVRTFAARRAPAPCDFTGDYRTWEEAHSHCQGYGAREILEKTRVAALQVKRGEAAFERDSVVFSKLEFSFPLLAGLMRAAAVDGGRLSVLDFGGALGCTYFQNRKFLAGLRELQWSVVEQPAHVECGRAEFATEQLNFYATIAECLRKERPNVLLLSSVLQYLPQPYEFLAQALTHRIPVVIVDRTAFLRAERTRLTIQHVPAEIYRATYPAWFLSTGRFLDYFANCYRLVATFPALDHAQLEGEPAESKGFIFELKP